MLSIHGATGATDQMIRQRTLKNVIRATGVGLHTGEKVYLTLRPAAVDFQRVDARGWSPEDLESRISREADRPFDLVAGPVARFFFFALRNC